MTVSATSAEPWRAAETGILGVRDASRNAWSGRSHDCAVHILTRAIRLCHENIVVPARRGRLPLIWVAGTSVAACRKSDFFKSWSEVRTALNDVLGGSAASVLTITFGLSYSLLIFTGPLAPYLSYGLAATFISIGDSRRCHRARQFVARSRSAAPESSTAAMTGILAARWSSALSPAIPRHPLLAPVLMTLGLSAIVTGIVLCGFGVTRMGRAIRYVPYPVVGGFLGATGCLIVLGAIRVITGHRLQFATLDQFANILTLSELAAACAMALVLYLTWHRSRNPFGLPAILFGGVDRRTCRVLAGGISLGRGAASGWTFQPPPSVSFMLPWSTTEIGRYPWHALPDLLGNLVAVIFVTAIEHLVQHHGHRGRRTPRSQSRAGTERHRPRQHPVGRVRRLYRLHFGQPHHPQFQQRRHRPARRPDGRRDLGADAGGRLRCCSATCRNSCSAAC